MHLFHVQSTKIYSDKLSSFISNTYNSRPPHVSGYGNSTVHIEIYCTLYHRNTRLITIHLYVRLCYTVSGRLPHWQGVTESLFTIARLRHDIAPIT